MDIDIFFQPVDQSLLPDSLPDACLGNSLMVNTTGDIPELTQVQLAIFGVNESRGNKANLEGKNAPDLVRQWLYRLFHHGYDIKIADLGNVKAGNEIQDTYFAVSQICESLIKDGIIPIIIGGSQDLTYANYLAYENLEQMVNLVTVDPRFDIGLKDETVDAYTFLSKIVLHQPSFLFNYSNIGYQSYFTDPKVLELMNQLYFDVYRLGMVRNNLEEVEPIVRNADIVSMDVNAIRKADAPGISFASPNGFNGEEACAIARYAGLSDKLTSFGVYDYCPSKDEDGTTAHLVAQMIWYFIDGYYNRKQDFPVGDRSQYFKYTVALESKDHELVFYKSNKSDRWWMEVPYQTGQNSKYERHHLVPCSYADYELALRDEMPDRWWKTYQKLC